MKTLKNKAGFSLIELVFAMFFLGIIILGVVNLQSSNLAMINRQNNQIQAHLIANESIQILKGIGYQKMVQINPTCQSGPCYFIRRNNRYELVGQREAPINNIFERSIELDSDGLTQAFKATVLIEWTDSTGEHRRRVNGELVNGHVEAKTIIF